MPSIKKNFHKLMRNLSNPGIQAPSTSPVPTSSSLENGTSHNQPGTSGVLRSRKRINLRRTVCSDSVQNYESAAGNGKKQGRDELDGDHKEWHAGTAVSYPNSRSPTIDGVTAEEEESGTFIQRYLNGEIRRIHPKVHFDRTGETLPVHILSPLDAHVCTCATGPEEGISQIPYLGSRRIYDKASSEDFYSAFPPETEEKLRHMPAMMRAAWFAKSGHQSYLPREAFQNLIAGKESGRKSGKNSPRGVGGDAEGKSMGEDGVNGVKKGASPKNGLPVAADGAEEATWRESHSDGISVGNGPSEAKTRVQKSLTIPQTSSSRKDPNLSKSNSLVSMTHIGTAPRARIEELLDEEAFIATPPSSDQVQIHLSQPSPNTDAPGQLNKIEEEEEQPRDVPVGYKAQESVEEMPVETFAEVVMTEPKGSDTDEAETIDQVDGVGKVNGIVEGNLKQAGNSVKNAVVAGQRRSLASRNNSKSKERKRFRSLHHQLLEDFPFCLESRLPWTCRNKENEVHPSIPSTSYMDHSDCGCGTDRAFGVSTTLYERNPASGEVAGSPIADVFAVCARENNAILAIADGVNWGDKARVAAQCAVRGAVDFLEAVLFQDGRHFRTTKELFVVLLDAMHAAHNLVLQEHGALATLCIAVICPLQEARRYVVCVCNVGDSFAYTYSRKFGVREITKGSHNVNSNRDMRDALGALGPVDGCTPELSNITCSMTIVEADDIVFLTTDGVSDNFDPVIGKFCVIENDESVLKQLNGVNGNKKDAVIASKKEKGRFDEEDVRVPLSLPSVTAQQRHELMLLRMEDLIRHGITLGDKPCSNARQLCQCFVSFALQLTAAKRHVLEDPDLYPPEANGEGKQNSRAQQRHQRRKACERLALMPGKLDHATLVAYQVGEWTTEQPYMPTSISQLWAHLNAQPNHESTPANSPLDEVFPVMGDPGKGLSQTAMMIMESDKDWLVSGAKRKNYPLRLIDSPDAERRSLYIASQANSRNASISQ